MAEVKFYEHIIKESMVTAVAGKIIGSADYERGVKDALTPIFKVIGSVPDDHPIKTATFDPEQVRSMKDLAAEARERLAKLPEDSPARAIHDALKLK